MFVHFCGQEIGVLSGITVITPLTFLLERFHLFYHPAPCKLNQKPQESVKCECNAKNTTSTFTFLIRSSIRCHISDPTSNFPGTAQMNSEFDILIKLYDKIFIYNYKIWGIEQQRRMTSRKCCWSNQEVWRRPDSPISADEGASLVGFRSSLQKWRRHT